MKNRRCPWHTSTASTCHLASFPRQRESRGRAPWGLDAGVRRHDVRLASDSRNRHLEGVTRVCHTMAQMKSVRPAVVAGVHGRPTLVEPRPLAGTGYAKSWREEEMGDVMEAAPTGAGDE